MAKEIFLKLLEEQEEYVSCGGTLTGVLIGQ